MFDRVSKFASLRREEQALLCTSAALLLSSRVLLPLVRLDRTYRGLHWFVQLLPPYGSVHNPEKIPWALEVATVTLPIECSCLMKALVGERLLARHGHQAHIRLGVASDQGFEAHAWVEREGEIIIGELEDQARYRYLSSYELEKYQ